jgi:hypothetical protein
MPRSAIRAPRIWAQINGANVDTLLHVDISNNGTGKSSRFELTVSIDGNAADGQWSGMLGGKVAVTVYMGIQPGNSSSVLFDGLADDIAVDPINRTARIIGRDYSSVLISSTYQQSYYNQTASEIAHSIAARHGFIPNISPTVAMVGSYQSDDHSQILLNVHSHITNEWDLLKYLARTEGFQLFVDGTTLVFAPADALPRNAWSINADDVMGLTFHQVCPISDQTTLTAKSWNSWLGQVFTYTDDRSVGQSASGLSVLQVDPGTEIATVRPNLMPQDVEQLVNQRFDALNEQALTVQIVMPGEMAFLPGDVLTITSGFASFNADYTVKSLRRRFSSAGGFVQFIQGFTAPTNSPSSSGTGALPVG